MSTQQMVVEMQGVYPFGQVHSVHPDVKILVRKIVPYTKYNYTRLKDKFQIAKTIEHINLIRLLRVLQQQGRFHLIYEYIPYPILHSPITLENLELIKMKLIYLCVYLVECGIITFLKLDNLGLDSTNEIRYYLDIDFQVAYLDEHKTHIHYIDQVNRIVDEMYGEMGEGYSEGFRETIVARPKSKDNKGEKLNQTKSIALDRRSSKRTSQSSGSGVSMEKSKSKEKDKIPLTGRTKPVSSTLQLLNSIQKKLDQLKQNIRRHSPKHTQPPPPTSSLLPNQPIKKPLTRTHILQRQRPIDKRKYSGDVRSMQSILIKNIAADSVRSMRSNKKSRLERIRESNGEDEERRQPAYSLAQKRTKDKELSLSKVIERKKKRFLLEDDQESQNTQQNNNRQRLKTKAKQQQPQKESELLLLSTATELIMSTEGKEVEKEQERRKPADTEQTAAEQVKEQNLKERISNALKKSDEAIGRYRKQSIHTISTEFRKRNS